PVQALLGAVGLRSEGLGLVPGNPLNLIQASESADEAGVLAQWFESQWASLPDTRAAKDELLRHITALASHRDPHLIYALVLHHLFSSRGDALDEEQVIKDRKSTRLNSSHVKISYAVFCLKKKIHQDYLMRPLIYFHFI